MPYSVKLTQGYTFSSDGTDKVTYGKLNQLGSPVVSLSGSIVSSDLASGAIDNNLIADDAVDGSKIADSSINAAHLTNSDQGSIYHMGASGWQTLSPGTSGQVLTTNGSNADAAWETPESISRITPAQIVSGTNGQILQTNSSGNAVWGSAASVDTGSSYDAGTPLSVSMTYTSNTANTVSDRGTAGTATYSQGTSQGTYNATYFGSFGSNSLITAFGNYHFFDTALDDAKLTAMGIVGVTDVSNLKFLSVVTDVQVSRSNFAGVWYRQGASTGKWIPVSYVGTNSFSSASGWPQRHEGGIHQVPVTGDSIDIRIMASSGQAGAESNRVGFSVIGVAT